MNVLGLSGSLRSDAHNGRLLRAAGTALPPGAQLRVWDGLGAVPPFSEDRERRPAAVVRNLRAAAGRADAVLISTPEYNGSFPGQLKNALDWLSRPWPDHALRDRPVAVIGASTGPFGAVWAQADLRRVLTRMGAQVLDDELPVGFAHLAFEADGRLRDGDAEAALHGLVAHLVQAASAPAPRVVTLAG